MGEHQIIRNQTILDHFSIETHGFGAHPSDFDFGTLWFPTECGARAWRWKVGHLTTTGAQTEEIQRPVRDPGLTWVSKKIFNM